MSDIVLTEGNNVLNVGMTRIVAKLYGVVTDAGTGGALSGVRVTINGLTTLTDSAGRYTFDGLNPGAYTIIFEKEGYDTITR